eukprot:1651302-Ditylum_brightwellii.AAC.1
MKWTESFKDHVSRKIGVWMIPLVYVVRANVIPPVLENRERSMPHTIKCGYVEADLVEYASHDHPTFKKDNFQ